MLPSVPAITSIDPKIGPAHGVQRAETGGAGGEQVVALAELVPVIEKDEAACQAGSAGGEGAGSEA